MHQPVVIFGGFFSYPLIYEPLRRQLAALTKQPAWTVEAYSCDWVQGRKQSNWDILLRKLDHSVKKAASKSPTGKVTLVGHSMGGILARLYLSPDPFKGVVYHGLRFIDHVISLGSPHNFKEYGDHGGGMSRWMEAHYPGAAFSPQVQYTSLAGNWLRGTQFGPRLSKFVYNCYDSVCGNGTVTGDGMVPLASALLAGSQTIVLDGVTHHWVLGEPWYGHHEVVPIWFTTIEERAKTRVASRV